MVLVHQLLIVHLHHANCCQGVQGILLQSSKIDGPFIEFTEHIAEIIQLLRFPDVSHGIWLEHLILGIDFHHPDLACRNMQS
ncbi:hypothetical protein D3C84_1057340 [compost metagenome]